MNSIASTEVWTSPELTVLVRNKPEETVLVSCKNGYGSSVGLGSSNDDSRCLTNVPNPCSGLCLASFTS
jgi:hypothetical protein